MVNPVLVALDFSELEEAESLARRLVDHVGGFKVGLELLMGSGPSAVTHIARIGLPVFADAKLHDIPNTVRGAAAGLASAGARWLTVHASGGGDMIEAAVYGMSESGSREAGVLAVTVLTSLDADDLADLGLSRTIDAQVAEMSVLSADSGAEGVICSPLEIGTVKGVAPELLAVTPGIRPADGDSHDQKRVMTPSEALRAGADYLVIGRSITRASDPVEAASRIADLVRHNHN